VFAPLWRQLSWPVHRPSETQKSRTSSTFVQGIHYEQSQLQDEREDWQNDLEEKTAQNPAPKQ
jgi:hypothetical protein